MKNINVLKTVYRFTYSALIKLCLILCLPIDLSAMVSITQVPGSPFASISYAQFGGGPTFPGINYSPDGKWLINPNNTNDGNPDYASLYDVALDGVLTPVYGTKYTFSGGFVASGAFSPDSQFLTIGVGQAQNPPNYPASLALFHVDPSTGVLTQLDPSLGLGHPSSTLLALTGTGTYPVPSYTTSIAYSPNGDFLAVSYNLSDSLFDIALEIYTINQATGALTFADNYVTGSPTNNTPNVLSFSPDSRFIAQSNQNHTFSIFSVDSSGNLTPIPGSPFTLLGSTHSSSAVSYSPDGNYLVVIDQSGSLYLYTLNSAGIPTLSSTIHASQTTAITSVAFSPDSAFIASANYLSHVITIYSVDEYGIMTQYGSPVSCGPNINCLAFSPIITDDPYYYGSQVYFLSGAGFKNITSYQFTLPTPPIPPTPPTPYYYPYDYPPDPPANATGKRKGNIFLDRTECILTITWTASSTPDVVSYDIYNGDTFIDTVLATSPLSFRTLLYKGDCGKNFSIVAVDEYGLESFATPVIVI